MSFARVRALVVVGVLVVAAMVFVIVAIARDTQDRVTAENCPAGYQLVDIQLREEKDVKINVYNATPTPGVATRVGNDFKNRKFQVLKMANDPLKKTVDGVAELRYGPKGVGSAHLLRAYFLDEADPAYDEKRTDDVVDVVIGNGFQQLATPTEKNQSLGEIGRPALPDDHSCPAPERDKDS